MSENYIWRDEMDDEILLSVIIATYNAEETIEKTLASLLNQTRDWYEIIFVDGESKDSTLKIIKETCLNHKSQVPIQIISEQDQGIYDAMNKGINMAKGEWVYFLNAGDSLYDENVFEKVERNLRKEYDVVYGNILDDYGFKREISKALPLPKIKYKMVFCHQAVFTHRQTMIKYMYDLQYDLCSDYNSFLSMYLDGKKFLYIDTVIAVYSRNGISSNSTTRVLSQYRAIQKKQHILGLGQNIEYVKRMTIHYLRTIKHKIVRKRHF